MLRPSLLFPSYLAERYVLKSGQKPPDLRVCRNAVIAGCRIGKQPFTVKREYGVALHLSVFIYRRADIADFSFVVNYDIAADDSVGRIRRKVRVFRIGKVIGYFCKRRIALCPDSAFIRDCVKSCPQTAFSVINACLRPSVVYKSSRARSS